jgi:hypothetical protein
MEKKQQPTHSKSKTNHSTILGELFFTTFNLILLTIVSWILLEVWFSVQIILSDSDNINSTFQKILSINQLINHYQYVDIVFNAFEKIKNVIHLYFGSYISETVINVIFNVTEIILTRSILFIEFIPFML